MFVHMIPQPLSPPVASYFAKINSYHLTNLYIPDLDTTLQCWPGSVMNESCAILLRGSGVIKVYAVGFTLVAIN